MVNIKVQGRNSSCNKVEIGFQVYNLPQKAQNLLTATYQIDRGTSACMLLRFWELLQLLQLKRFVIEAQILWNIVQRGHEYASLEKLVSSNKKTDISTDMKNWNFSFANNMVQTFIYSNIKKWWHQNWWLKRNLFLDNCNWSTKISNYFNSVWVWLGRGNCITRCGR